MTEAVAKTIHYDLRETTDPLLRLGILGLWWYLTEGSKNPSRYPAASPTETFQWATDGEHTLTITYMDAEKDLNPLLDNQLGDMREGVAIPPGYATNPLDPAYYMTALAHWAFTALIFKPGSATGARRAKSINGTYGGTSVKGNKTKKGGKPLLEGLKQLPDFDEKKLISKVDCVTRWEGPPDNPVEVPIVRKINPWTTIRYLPHPSDPSITLELRQPLTVDMSLAAIHHPTFLRWNNIAVSPFIGRIPPEVKIAKILAYTFTALGYVYTGIPGAGGPGLLGLGLDLPTFPEFRKKMLRHVQAITENSRFITSIEGNPRLAAFFLIGQLGLPRDQAYPIVFTVGKDVGSDIFTPGAGSGSKTYDALRSALDRISETHPIDVKKLFCGLRRHLILPGKGKEDPGITIYDRLYENIENGRRWCAGFSDLLIPGKDDSSDGPRDRYPKILRILITTLGDNMEKQILEEMGRIIGAMAAKRAEDGYSYKDYRNGAWPRAKEDARNILLRACDKTSFHRAIAELSDKAKVGFSVPVLTYLHAQKDISLSISILTQGIWALRPAKKPAAVPTTPGTDPTVPESVPDVAVEVDGNTSDYSNTFDEE